MVRSLVAVAIAGCLACQGQGSRSAGTASGAPVSTGSDASPPEPAIPEDGGLAAGDLDPRDARTKPEEPEVPDPSRVIAELGAIPAWQAVVDRAQLLARRGQHGVVYGVVGPALMIPAPVVVPPLAPVAGDAGAAGDASAAGDAGAAGLAPAAAPVGPPIDAGLVKSPYVWLIDDTEGNGALGIRIALGDKAQEGDRIAAGGAWQLDAERRWFWKPDTVQPLPPGPGNDLKEPQPPEPSHAIAGGSLPAGVRTISVARDNDAVYFQIVGPAPASDGDGWQIADQLGSPVVAVMNLPGERATYGGQDMRAADERWQLKRGQVYWVRIGKLRKRGPDKPTTVNARTAPVRVL